MKRQRPIVTRVRRAGCDHAVASVQGDGGYRREVCAECPWRRDSPVGSFPAQAYRLSAETAYDAAQTAFACHMSGAEHPQTCAGFLMSYGAQHNLAVRVSQAMGRIDLDKVRATVPTYDTYREMAVANGVDEKDPALRLCRDKP